MYKIMFVDDEEQNLFLMEKIVDWEEMGFRVSGIALDGVEGIQVFEEIQPDVVFVDIRMDEMDGLELIEKLRQEEKKAVYVIVTAYDEFSYAKRAISLGVTDYLLKPVSRKEMIPMLQKIRASLDDERRHECEYKSNVFAEAFEMMEEGCLKGKGISELPRLDSVIGGCRLCWFELFSPTEPVEALLQVTEEWSYTYRFGGYDSVFLIIPVEEREAFTECFEKLMKYQMIPQYILRVGCSFGDTESLIAGYMESFESRNRCFYAKKSCIYASDGEKENAYSSAYVHHNRNYGEYLQKLIYSGFPDEVVALVRIMAQEASENRSLPDELVDEMIDLLFLIKSQLTGVYQDRAFMVLRHQNIWELHKVRTVSGLMDRMERWVTEAAEAVKDILENKGSYSLIGRAANYIREHCSNPEFSAGETAEAVHLSRNYFLKLFKEEMGISFLDYVTNIRMEKAKKLLKESDETIYAVSLNVGYESQYHFSRKFKNLYGISPNEFRSL